MKRLMFAETKKTPPLPLCLAPRFIRLSLGQLKKLLRRRSALALSVIERDRIHCPPLLPKIGGRGKSDKYNIGPHVAKRV